MESDDARPGLGKIGNDPIHRLHHQMHVDRNIDQWTNRRADHRSDGEIRHIVVVHHVEMDEVGTGLHDSGNLRAKAGEIRGENTRSDAGLHGALLSDVETGIATS